MSNPSLRWGLIAGFAVAIGIVAGAVLLKPDTVEIRSGTLLVAPRPIIDFTMQSTDGKPFTKADFAGHWTVIFPGFTFCPDICPTTLAVLRTVQEKLGDEASKVQIVMLSVDPERDTPEKLGHYVHAFSPSFTGITGSALELDRLGANLGYVYSKVEGATPGTYTIDHSAAMIVVGPDANLIGYFTPPYKVADLTADLRAITEGRARAS